MKEWNPGKILSVSGGYWQSFALHSAVKLDIFSKIPSQGIASEDLADRLTFSIRGLRALLNALCAMGLLEKKGTLYFNTPWSEEFLRKESDRYIGYMIMHHHHLVKSWARLDEAVQSGKPVRSGPGDEKERESFLMGMFNNAMAIAPKVAEVIKLNGRESLLDMGGGPGTYAIYFCLKNPGLKAVVYDLPTTEPYAMKVIERFNLKDRITFQGGDYLKEDIPGRYDVAWLSHIIHSLGEDECSMVIKKAYDVLNKDGLIFIHDFFLNQEMTGPLFPALFSLNMLVNTESGRSYSADEVKKILEGMGAKDIRMVDFEGPTQSTIISARKS